MATDQTSPVCPRSVRTTPPETRSHSRTAPSLPPSTSVRPSRDWVKTLRSGTSAPSSTCWRQPRVSQIFSDAWAAAASHRPSGLNASGMLSRAEVMSGGAGSALQPAVSQSLSPSIVWPARVRPSGENASE